VVSGAINLQFFKILRLKREEEKFCAYAITQKLQSERKYAAFGKYIVQEVPSLAEEMPKYRKRIIKNAIFEAQLGTLNRTAYIAKWGNIVSFAAPV
jgi:hypothetical protein